MSDEEEPTLDPAFVAQFDKRIQKKLKPPTPTRKKWVPKGGDPLTPEQRILKENKRKNRAPRFNINQLQIDENTTAISLAKQIEVWAVLNLAYVGMYSDSHSSRVAASRTIINLARGQVANPNADTSDVHVYFTNPTDQNQHHTIDVIAKQQKKKPVVPIEVVDPGDDDPIGDIDDNQFNENPDSDRYNENDYE